VLPIDVGDELQLAPERGDVPLKRIELQPVPNADRWSCMAAEPEQLKATVLDTPSARVSEP